MNETVGQAVYVIKLDDAQAIQQLDDFTQKLTNTSNEGEQQTKSLASGFDGLVSSITNLATAGVALSGTVSGIKEMTSAFNDYQSAMNGVGSVAAATGNSVVSSLNAVKDASSGGLISQADAAASIKNLQLYGYSVEQATQMIQIMTDAAVYNRQANYSVSEAVRVTTEGIRMENSVLSDASGITTNIAKMYENYAAQLGKTANQLTQTEKAQAVYNGFLQEGSVFAGNAENYTNTLAGAQQRLDTALSEVKQTMGAVFAQFAPIIKGLGDWISENQELVAGIITTVGIITAAGGLVAAFKVAQSAISAFRNAMVIMGVTSKAAQGGLAGLAVAAASVGGALAVAAGANALADEMERVTNTSAQAGSSLGGTSDELQSLEKNAKDAAERIAELEKQLSKIERDYNSSLKQIAIKHQKNLETLTQQIQEANIDYMRAVDERNAAFNVTLAKQERSHQEMVNELMTQLNFLQRYNNDYNKQKLLQVKLALADEERLYQRETEAQQREIDLQNEADKQRYEAKLQQLQEELNEELAFMEKHREKLNTVRDFILDDEIESLTRQYEEQKASYEKQIKEAAEKGAEAANAYWDAYMKNQTAKLDTMKVQVKDFQESIKWTLEDNKNQSVVLSPDSVVNMESAKRRYDFTMGGGGWASGGYTGRGAPDEVAGVVHKGEYVVPADMVNQNTGEPKMGVVNNYTISLTGVLADSQQAKRQFAQDIIKAIEQTNQSRLVQSDNKRFA